MLKRTFQKNYFNKRKKDDSAFFVEKPPFPKNCIVELTNACNHACIFCTSPKMERKISYLSKDKFSNFINQAKFLGLNDVGFYATGEPLMAKHIDWFIDTTKKSGIERVYITTNGALANLEKIKKLVSLGLDSIKFSINAATRESYKLIHGYDDFDKVMQNLKSINEWKNKNNIRLQLLGSFIYTAVTEKEIPIFKEKFSDLFEDILFCPTGNQGGNNQEVHKLFKNVTKNEVAEFQGIDQGLVDSKCKIVFNRLTLTAEGYLTACCVDYENNLTYADINKENFSLADGWHNQIITSLRQKHLLKKFDNVLCHSCITGKEYPYKPISNLRAELAEKNNKIKFLEDRLKIHNNKIVEAL